MNSIIEPKLESNTRPTTGPRLDHSLEQNLDREPREDILGGPGDNYDVYKYSWPMSVIRRRALVYSPRSTARHNFGLLPDVGQMAGMELAYRQQAFRDDEIAGHASRRVALLFIAASVCPVPLIALGRLLPYDRLLQAACILSLVWMSILVVLRCASLRPILKALFGPLTILLAAKAIAAIFSYRIVGAAVGSAAAGALTYWLWARPFQFYLQWLYTHPRLKPETRRKIPTFASPDWRLLAITLTLIVVGPLVSTALTIAALFVLPFVVVKSTGSTPRELIRAGIHVLAPFLTYGGPDAYAPGVWHPPVPYATRRWTSIGLFIPLMLTLALGLSLFIPLGDYFIKWPVLAAKDGSVYAAWHETIREGSERWLFNIVGRVFITGQINYIWYLPVALAIGSLLPPLLLAAIFRAPLEDAERAQYDIARSGLRSGVLIGLDNDGRTEWQWYVDRIKDSPHSAPGPLGDNMREADHLFLGVEPHARFPVLLDQKLLAEHMYMVGDSGSGKTSLGLMPLLMQLIKGHTNEEGNRTDCPPIVILDLKGDPALFQLARKEALARGKEFKFFTPEKGRASHYFNPFGSLDSDYRTDMQLCNILMDSLSLNHGEGYGRGYYGRQTRSLLLAAMSGERRAGSLKELVERLRNLREDHPNEYKDTMELVSTVEALATYKNLAIRTSPKNPAAAIHMPTVLQDQQVVYFYLPAAVESVSVREIAKLALYSLLTACIDRHRSHAPHEQRQVYLFIDEFQRIAGENFRIILEQARSFGLSVTLANQSVSDLKTPDVDLRPTVRTNTRVKRFFSLSDPQDVQAMVDASGEELSYMRSWSQFAGATYTEHIASAYNSRSDTQSVKPRFTKNDVMAISDHPLDSILQVSRGSGYTQFAGLPIAVRCPWPISREQTAALKNAEWPTIEELGPDSATTNDLSPLDIERTRDLEVAQEALGLMAEINAAEA